MTQTVLPTTAAPLPVLEFTFRDGVWYAQPKQPR